MINIIIYSFVGLVIFYSISKIFLYYFDYRKKLITYQNDMAILEDKVNDELNPNELAAVYLDASDKYMMFLESGTDVKEYRYLLYLVMQKLIKVLGGNINEKLKEFKINDKDLNNFIKDIERDHPEWKKRDDDGE